MSLSEHVIDDPHPIDLVETLAERHDWEFDRLGEDQIAMAVDGSWRTYALTLAWSDRDAVLRLLASFEMDPPVDRLPEMYALLNAANEDYWSGAFCYWTDQKLMTFRTGLLLSGGQIAAAEQVTSMIAGALGAMERFYPAFQLVGWGNSTAGAARQVALAEAYGRA